MPVSHEAAFAALPPTMAACTGPDVPATRFAPTEGLVASPLQGRPVDIGSLGPVVVAPRSGQRRALAVHGSRNEGAALPRAALCGTAPLRYAEEVPSSWLSATMGGEHPSPELATRISARTSR